MNNSGCLSGKLVTINSEHVKLNVISCICNAYVETLNLFFYTVPKELFVLIQIFSIRFHNAT